MENKIGLKKYLKISLIYIIILSFLFLVIENIETKKNINDTNLKILFIVNNLKTKYPDISDDEIYNILKDENKTNKDFSNKYSVNIEKESLIKLIDNNNYKYKIIKLTFFIISLITNILIFLKYNRIKDKNIEMITKLIEEINKKNYKLELNEMSEDELSILKNEIYKTTIMLKEQAENSHKDKIKLKESLSDISHQLKTPLTAIMIRLDNLIDYPNMNELTKEKFIKEIKMEITNINFFVQSILKLSKLDSNTVIYNNDSVKLSELVNESVNRLLPLCDLKNIKINLFIENDGLIICDKTWQIEAILNIIKNSIEHSKDNNCVDIKINYNNVYGSISIKDYGIGINKLELNHIFDRFYKGKNSDDSSIGIGLALSKSIIKKNNGTISVESEEGKYTCFTIKYYK